MAHVRGVVGFALAICVQFGFSQTASLSSAPPSATAILESEAYVAPPADITRLILAPRWENITLSDLSPDRKTFAVTLTGGMPSLSALGKAHKNLGGFQVDTLANRSRSLTIRQGSGIRLIDSRTGKALDVSIPKGCGVSGTAWSPDGTMLAYIASFEDRSLLYVADVQTGKSRLLSKRPLLATWVTSPDWTGDGRSIAAVFVPDPRTEFPSPALIAAEPKVRLGDASKHRFRTYPSLLENPYDQKLLEYYSIGQLAMIEARSGRMTTIGSPAMVQSVEVSPDGKYFRVRTLQKPFSYLVPVSSFGSKEELWDEKGKVLAEIASTPLNVADAGQANRPPPPTAKRGIAWRPDGSGLSFIEVEPVKREAKPDTGTGEDEQGRGQRRGGAATPQDNRKDRVMQWLPPFGKDDAKVVWTAENRISGVRYSKDCRTLFITDTKDGNDRIYAVSLDEPSKLNVISSAKSDEFYEAPGSLLSYPGPNSQLVVAVSTDGSVYLSGTKYDKEPKRNAPRPFLDKIEIKSGKKTRIWESSEGLYESLGAILDDDAKQAVVTRQGSTMVPNAFCVELATRSSSHLTNNKDATPEITACQRYALDVVRADGFKFQCKVTLPANWTKGNRLPAIFWFYPAEFADQTAYDRTIRTYNRNAFPSVSSQSMALLTQLGYAFVEPDLPIVGLDGSMNDNYVSDLVNSLYAVINKLDSEGMADRDRLAISGHSYGAFSTANALMHTPFFKAGIAGSGDYNRSLTPFGFQNEQRQYWEARDLYQEMSPFNYANHMTGALLMTHGMEDQNVGTNPINSERLFQALTQLGKPCALYMYPYEDHGQIAKETVLDKWARWIAWLDKYVKGSK